MHRITLLDNLTVVDHEVGKIYELPLAGQRSRAVFGALILAAQAQLLRRDLDVALRRARQLSDDALDAVQWAGQPAALVSVLLDRGFTPPQRLEDVLVSEQAGAALLEQFGGPTTGPRAWLGLADRSHRPHQHPWQLASGGGGGDL